MKKHERNQTYHVVVAKDVIVVLSALRRNDNIIAPLFASDLRVVMAHVKLKKKHKKKLNIPCYACTRYCPYYAVMASLRSRWSHRICRP
jgi:hypothetical protein